MCAWQCPASNRLITTENVAVIFRFIYFDYSVLDAVSTSGDVHRDCMPPWSVQQGWGYTKGSLPTYLSPNGKPLLSFSCREMRLFVQFQKCHTASHCNSLANATIQPGHPRFWLSEDSSRYEICLLSCKDVLSWLQIVIIHADAGMHSQILPVFHHPPCPRACGGRQKKGWRSQPGVVRLPATRGSALGSLLHSKSPSGFQRQHPHGINFCWAGPTGVECLLLGFSSYSFYGKH